MVDHPIVIDEHLRSALAALEGALNVTFDRSAIERVFADAENDQISEKRYTFHESSTLRVLGYVEDYEPETIELVVEGSKKLQRRCAPILEAVIRRSAGEV